jgi:predicted membrane protein
MGEQKNFLKFTVASFFLFIATIAMMPLLGPTAFAAEAMMLLFLAIAAIVAARGIYACKSWARAALIFFTFIAVLNVLLIYIVVHKTAATALFTLVAIVAAIAGATAASGKMIIKRKAEPEVEYYDEPADEKEKEEYEKYEKKLDHDKVGGVEIVMEDLPELKDKDVLKSYHPGKFISTTKSKLYHKPGCAATKRFNAENEVWFKDKKEAKQRGYRPHSCVD